MFIRRMASSQPWLRVARTAAGRSGSEPAAFAYILSTIVLVLAAIGAVLEIGRYGTFATVWICWRGRDGCAEVRLWIRRRMNLNELVALANPAAGTERIET
jgi:hypothetical protein